MKFNKFDTRGRTLGIFIKGDISCMLAGTFFISLVIFVLTGVITGNLITAITNFAWSWFLLPISFVIIFIERISDIKMMKEYESIKESQ